MKKGEFSFIGDIATMFASLPHSGFEPIGDDCTVFDMGDDALVISTDMLVEDVHFLRNISSAAEVGCKSLMVNISDVAAMGAKPVATLLSLSLPESAQGEWAEAFMREYYAQSEKYGIALVGGDTTASRDRITINVVAIGRAAKCNIKRRSAAKVGTALSSIVAPTADSSIICLISEAMPSEISIIACTSPRVPSHSPSVTRA